MKRFFAVFMLAMALGCGQIEKLTGPAEAPESTDTEVEVVDTEAAEEEFEIEEPEEPEVVVLTSEEARQRLANRNIPYTQKAFIAAAEEGNLEIVRLFVWSGLDVNVQPYTARMVYVPTHPTPTRLAHLQATWFEGEEDNDTALMKAAGAGHLNVVQFLVESGADPRLKNRQKQHAVMFAAAGGHLEVVQYLVEEGGAGGYSFLFPNMGFSAPPGGWLSIPPQRAQTWAAYHGHLDVVQYFFELSPGARDGKHSASTMYWAAAGSHLDVVQYMIDQKDRWSGGSKGHHFPGAAIYSLIIAGGTNQVEMAQLLMDNGAHVHGRTFSWITIETPDGALYYKDIGVNAAQAAIAQGHSEVLRVILNHWISKHGADGRDQHGTSVLMLAAAGGDLELVEELLSYEVPVNITTDVGTTALMMAAAWDQTECVKKLLDAGADRSLVNGHGYTALDLALENGHQETAEVLQ